ncbi:hypothetical protein Back2_08370 [Nocardioides baekrokdamisoli]|uniref:Uncharacterized protein n=1 Tax=Nocardioides baekrokdamisoli TaxID=1804624 RepID=A0A3G9ICA2_9ACTN|nr:hypothetical protein Back2_08370 [Nocardioides baekrokdamisoli]
MTQFRPEYISQYMLPQYLLYWLSLYPLFEQSLKPMHHNADDAFADGASRTNEALSSAPRRIAMNPRRYLCDECDEWCTREGWFRSVKHF